MSDELMQRDWVTRTRNGVRADYSGFMKQLPNLLKQESSAAATLINVLLRMYRDPREAHRATRNGVLERLVP